MTQVPVPRELCAKISDRAVQLARESARSFGWSDKTITAMLPMAGEPGTVGIQSSLKYVFHQDRGTKPFLMWWVQGRTLPMGCGQGDGPHFRRGSHVGEPGYVNIPHVGKVWRDQRWRHPGIKAKHFLEEAIDKAIAEAKPEIDKTMMEVMFSGR